MGGTKIRTTRHARLLRECFFGRHSNRNECDLLPPAGISLDVLEIKARETIYPKAFQGMDCFRTASGGRVPHKNLFSSVAENQHRSE